MRFLLALALVLTSAHSLSGQLCRRCTKCGQVHCEPASQPQLGRPRVSNKFNYPRQIDPRMQARAQQEAGILARSSFQRNQRLWTANPANGHPIGVLPGYIGGTGCSDPGGSGVIRTCEPRRRLLLVAEAFAKGADGTWYASRTWKQ